ncbi:MAG TPA: YbaK/EbsC family protein [Acidimicrobiia bacterium]|nr:YbaK/EbsC family protein [Acidimicrobiia bacterium]
MTIDNPALRHLGELGVDHEVRRHGRVDSLLEAAEARGVDPADLIKTMVVRRGHDDYVLVLVPGDRTIAWPRLRQLLGVNRLSMPDADEAKAATGYERGTITPFGTTRSLPLVADERIGGHMVSIGGGDHGVGVLIDGDVLLTITAATVADVTDPQ